MNETTHYPIAPWTDVPADAPMPNLNRAAALEVVRGLDRNIIEIRELVVEFDCDDDVDEGGVWTWTAKVWIEGHWYIASIPDHYEDGAEIDWSRPDPEN